MKHLNNLYYNFIFDNKMNSMMIMLAFKMLSMLDHLPILSHIAFYFYF